MNQDTTQRVTITRLDIPFRDWFNAALNLACAVLIVAAIFGIGALMVTATVMAFGR